MTCIKCSGDAVPLVKQSANCLSDVVHLTSFISLWDSMSHREQMSMHKRLSSIIFYGHQESRQH